MIIFSTIVYKKCNFYLFCVYNIYDTEYNLRYCTHIAETFLLNNFIKMKKKILHRSEQHCTRCYWSKPIATPATLKLYQNKMLLICYLFYFTHAHMVFLYMTFFSVSTQLDSWEKVHVFCHFNTTFDMYFLL